jgi:16S rRNA (cytosine1402-N4)-methyltransferase
MSAPREPRHAPVMPAETLRLLDPKPGETWVDCTVGAGGHSRLIAEKLANPGRESGGVSAGRLLGLDQDPGMLEIARGRLAGLPVELVHANFDQLPDVLANRGVAQVDGVFADLGFASDQMDNVARGLSFRADGPLDMRLDPTTGATAAEYVNDLSEAALADVFWEFGEERHSRRVARKIVERRKSKPLATTAELAEVVRSAVPRSGSIDPATRVFQALRIAVNDELGALDRLLAALPKMVKPGGRVGIISFHSLEDRRVKHALRDRDLWEALTKKPVEAGDAELAANPRSRSAKLRVARRM